MNPSRGEGVALALALVGRCELATTSLISGHRDLLDPGLAFSLHDVPLP